METLLLIWRSFSFAAFIWTSLSWVGLVPTFVLVIRDWREFRFALVPLVGWSVYVIFCYILLPIFSLRQSLIIIGIISTVVNTIALAVFVGRKHSWRRIAPHMALRVLGLAIANSAIFFVLLLPHIYHQSLAVLPPNQDDEYFVELTDRMWSGPQGLRLAFGDYIIERGWAFHLVMALSRLTPWLDAFESVSLTGYFAIAIAVGPNYVLLRTVFELPVRWAMVCAAGGALHGLLIWTPSYGFGPNSVAIAAAPFAYAAICRGSEGGRLRDLALAALAMSLTLTAHTPLMIFPVVLIFAGQIISWIPHRRLHYSESKSAISRLILTGFGTSLVSIGALSDAFHWAWGGSWDRLLRLAVDPVETDGAGWGMTEFPTLGNWLGTQPWEFVSPQLTSPLATRLFEIAGIAGTLAAIGFLLVGLVGCFFSRRRSLIGLVLGVGMVYLYARYLKAFPLAVYKIQTVTALVLLGILSRGVISASSWRPSPRWAHRIYRREGLQSTFSQDWFSRRLSALTMVGVAAMVGAFGISTARTLGYGFQPWEPLLTVHRLADVRAIIEALPPDAPAVEVSGKFVVSPPDDALGVRDHPTAYHSFIQARQGGAMRLRAALDHQARVREIQTTGIFQRTVASTVVPVSVVQRNTTFHIVGADEDLRFYGVNAASVISKTSTLTLFSRPPNQWMGREPFRNDAGWQGTLETAPLTYSVPCDQVHHRGALEQSDASTECGVGAVRMALLVSSPGVITISVTDGSGVRVVPLYLEPGLYWYVSRQFSVPMVVNIDTHGTSLVAGVSVISGDSGDSYLDQITSGAVFSTVRVEGGVVKVDAIWAGPGDVQGSTFHRVELVNSPVGKGLAYPSDVDPGQRFQAWQWEISPGKEIIQRINGNVVPTSGGRRWPEADGTQWLRLRFTDSRAPWDDVVVASMNAQAGSFVSAEAVTSLSEVRLRWNGRQQGVAISDGALVKGTQDRVFVIDGGLRRWVPSIEILISRGWTWDSIRTIPDDVLLTIPIGLPVAE
ncbi:unannotated protein [freshwater metagenome]|uniref:Unannotated protein n=1 Tax=freshwater metagenome TaxID=449393 RepID=A0A6J7EI18_9ZZZZ